MPDVSGPPGAVVCCVGGGGLLTGIYQGLRKAGWHSTAVIAAETQGAASFSRSVKEGKLITLDRIATIASTLGAPKVTPTVIAHMHEHKAETHAIGDVTDREAVDSLKKFQKDHRVLVEPSCGAALSMVYESRHARLLPDTVIMVVCGGSGVDMDILRAWDEKV